MNDQMNRGNCHHHNGCSELLWYSPAFLVCLCVICHREARNTGKLCAGHISGAIHLVQLVWLSHHPLPTNAFADYPKAASFCIFLANCPEQESLGNGINPWTSVMCLVDLKWRACLAPGGWYRHVPTFCLAQCTSIPTLLSQKRILTDGGQFPMKKGPYMVPEPLSS